MSNIVDQLFNDKTTSRYILFYLLVISGFLAALFWRYPLNVYDAAGHVSLVRSITEEFWPRMSGWNSSELLGWPAGMFYPSLFHWLAATLSFLIGIENAIKVLITVAFIGLPISVNFFVRSLTKNKFWSTAVTLGLFILILLFPNFLGTGVHALFQIGLLSNFFVLPLIFFFLVSLHRRSSYVVSGLLLALIILTHIVGAIVAGIYLVLFLLTRSGLVMGLKTIGLAAVLTIFFWVPFLANLEYTSVSRHVSSYFLPNVVVGFIAAVLVIFAWKKKDSNIFTLSLVCFVLAAVAAVDAYLIRTSGTSFFLYQFHIYRFQPFAYMFFATAVALVAIKNQQILTLGENKNIKIGVYTGALLLILGSLLFKNPASLPNIRFEQMQPQVVQGRLLETFRRTESNPFWYSLQTEMNAENQNASWAYGLFTDSSPNGPYLGSLIRSLRPEAYPEGEGPFIETRFIDQGKISQMLPLFGINYLVHLGGTKGEPIGTLHKRSAAPTALVETETFYAEKISIAALFDVVRLPLKPVETGWDKQVEGWWSAKGEITEMPYQMGEQEISEASEKDLQAASVKVVEVNKEQTRFKLNVKADTPVPILAKISYLPYWSARSAGKAIPIYRAAPNLMLFEAKGEVELVYQEPVWINWLSIVSGITWLIAILAVIQMTNVKFRMSNEAQNPKSKKV